MGDTGKRALLFAAAAVAVLTLAVSANASTLTFDATLLGTNENPANASLGTGFITAVLNDVTNALSVSENFSGLTAGVTVTGIHCCAASNGNAPFALNFVSSGFPTGVTSGTFSHTFNLSSDLIGFSAAAFIANLEAGLTYADIVDTNFPAGEIRGQLLLAPVPLPAALPLFATGLGTLGLLAWWKRRKKYE
jgi:hypothetical protein